MRERMHSLTSPRPDQLLQLAPFAKECIPTNYFMMNETDYMHKVHLFY